MTTQNTKRWATWTPPKHPRWSSRVGIWSTLKSSDQHFKSIHNENKLPYEYQHIHVCKNVMLQWTFQLSKNLRILQLRRQCVPWNWLLMTTLKELMFVNCYKYAFVCKECCIFQTCNSHLDQNVLQSHSFFMYNKTKSRQFGTKTFRYPLKRQFGTKTFRNPLKKTVRH